MQFVALLLSFLLIDVVTTKTTSDLAYKCHGEPRIHLDEKGNAKTCEMNSDCLQGEFCDVRAIKDGEPVSICCAYPKCGGAPNHHYEVGQGYCNTLDGSGCDHYHNFYCVSGDNFGNENSLWKENEGVCCRFDCTEKPKHEVWQNAVAFANNECDPDATTGSCDSSLNTVAVCETFPSLKPHSRCCRYTRVVSKCAYPFYQEIRHQNGSSKKMEGEVEGPCEYSHQCRNHANSKCGATQKIIPETEKICCEAFVCPDHFTSKVDPENRCTRDEDCEETGMRGVCDDGYCCPKVSNLKEITKSTKTVIEVEFPFQTTIPCTKVADCEGESRFCDIVSKRCTYYGPSATAEKQRKNRTCGLNDLTCGEIDGDRTVCMIAGLPGTGTPYCYKHPLDLCKKNENCKEDEYCGVALHVHFDVSGNANRTCRKTPKGAVRNESGVELKECKTDEDCGETLVCHQQKDGYRAYCRTDGCHLNKDCEKGEFCNVHAGEQTTFACQAAMNGNTVIESEKAGLLICKERKDCNNAKYYCEKDISSINIKIPNDFGFCARDECHLNSDCEDGYFCNAHVDENKRHICEEPLHSNVIIWRNKSGLFPCNTREGCTFQIASTCSSGIISPNIIVSPETTGFCAFNDYYTCRGMARMRFDDKGAIKTCDKNSDCNTGEFCDHAATLTHQEVSDGQPSSKVTGGQRICCAYPKCGGEVVNIKEVGITTCNPLKGTGCGPSEYCVSSEYFRGQNSTWSSNEGVCCKYNCNQKPKTEVRMFKKVLPRRHCGPESDVCESSLNIVAVCETFPSLKPHSRCCRYDRIVSKCASPYNEEIRDKRGNAIPCEYSHHCRKHANSKCGDTKIKVPGIEKMCCEAAVCRDHFTDKIGSENVCSRDEDCDQNGMRGVCDDGHCCPKVSNLKEIAKGTVIEVEFPFQTTIPCTKVADCEGESRFCDIVSKRCTYYGPSAKAETQKKNRTCGLDDLTCGEIDGDRTVCMTRSSGPRFAGPPQLTRPLASTA